ncbi:hypothetical protein BEWA_020750 [Theileria equi strain WA]|uniref:Uncharacterized protein n=1 Tax=Theileria equi strain WA TaxID=1537102 RepID=L0AVF6_THEEQ|nr:hypothetical protein BEWA_020750 [Theileria equi strain WA]AFZ79228.1 hypothetical protein BEWA_020750 [Theileria equi strain WA]|eukprot:XP_004828894.1 hypothetical protein BEWA_020750 [Theileria equi strain WA]
MSKDGLQKGAMFMAGLTLLQSLRVALTGAKFALDRFKIPQQYASSFINMVHNPMELATFTGMAIVTSIALLTDGSNGSFKEFFKYLAIFTNIALCCSFILLLIAFTSGGQMGNLTFYYWTIVFGSFIYGLNVAAVMTVGSDNASLFNMGIPISGIQVCIYYYIFTKLAEWSNFSNVSYWIIFWQLIIAILISAASAVVWAIGQADGGKSDGQPGAGAVSPIFMGMVGMGGIYAFYPAIAPYKLTDVGTGYTIDLVVLFISAVPGIIIAILCLCNNDPKNGIGPNQEWTNEKSGTGWNFAWIMAFPHILAMFSCLYVLHHPDSEIASTVKSSGALVGVITVTLKFCEESLKAVSYAGGGAYGGTISSLNTFTSQFLMIVLAFTGDGYLKTYSKYENDKDKWPTEHCGFFKSLGYWIGNGVSEACKSVKSSFTKNVRCKVLGKSEALLIVYADEEF